MKIVTQQDEIEAFLAERAGPVDSSGMSQDWTRRATAQTAAMAALNPKTATLEQVLEARRVFAHDDTRSGAELMCDECDQLVPAVAHLGMEPDYDARWWRVCAGCLQSALSRFPSPSQEKG